MIYYGMVLAYGIGGFFLGINNNGWRYVLVSGAVLSIPILIIRSRIKESESWKELLMYPIWCLLESLILKLGIQKSTRLNKYTCSI